MKILLALDLSDFSEAAVAAVIAQFPPQGHEVHLLHAVDWEPHLPTSYLFARGPNDAKAVLDMRDRMVGEAEAYLTRAAERLRAAGFTVTTEVRPEGDARHVILKAAEKWPADLLVVGSHGRSGLDRLLLGSVSERVVRQAPCSVEVVRLSRQGAA